MAGKSLGFSNVLPTGKSRILIVDSSRSNRELLCDCLRQLPDAVILTASDGAQAVEMFSATHPSLILMDANLSDQDGIALARKIRSREQLASDQHQAGWTPIILLSSLIDEELLAKSIIAGADDFLYKPVSEVILLAKVRAMLRIVSMQRDIHTAHRRLRELATLDGLTCIPNRRHFDETLNTEWKRCSRSNSPLSIVLGDIDFFKQFNDIYGHQAGDSCLKAVAGALSDSLFRVEDTVARYGGEEFVAVLPGTDIQGAMAVAERMRRSARDLCITHKQGVDGMISCSFGVSSIYPQAISEPYGLIKAADTALYRAKHNGRNSVFMHSESVISA